MFCSFEKVPNILRLYGLGKEIKPTDEEWNNLISLIPEIPRTRQFFDIIIESTQTSCGMSISFYEFKGKRNDLNNWATNQGKENIEK